MDLPLVTWLACLISIVLLWQDWTAADPEASVGSQTNTNRRLWRQLFGSGRQEVDQPMPRIHRGWFLEPHEFPWVVKIKSYFPRRRRGGRRLSRDCGGALLNPRWVITARHCVTWNPPFRRGRGVDRGPSASMVKVYVGGHEHFGEDGALIMAEEAIGRDDYGRPQCVHRGRKCRGGLTPLNYYGFLSHLMSPRSDDIFTNDIVLIRLSHPVPITSKVQPVQLPTWNKDYLGDRAYVAGWGLQVKDSSSKGSKSYNSRRGFPTSILKAAELKVIRGERSPACWGQRGFGKMCAVAARQSPRGGSVCPGDSGSPMVVWDGDNGGWTLVGLLSNGARDCFSEMPAVYTRVGDYLEWIHKTIQDVP